MLVIFDSFSAIFHIFDLCILKFVLKRSMVLQRKFLEARFWAPKLWVARIHYKSMISIERVFEKKIKKSLPPKKNDFSKNQISKNK